MKGKVYLVGAGPGDPDLLTLKAARILRNADVVLHDDLVSAEILHLLPHSAERVNVGKRCGAKKISQEEINFLLVTLAATGRSVVRLKSGDPLVFGRAGEEILALRKAGIEFEVVPGVTAALGAAAAAQMSLTHRQISPAVVFVTGHRATSDPVDWRALVALRATLVVYMPGQNYREIAGRLRDAGMAEETPCAIVSKVSTPQEQSHFTHLRHLPNAPHLPAPTLLVIGDVVRTAGPLLTEELAAWNCPLPHEKAVAAHEPAQEQ